MFEPFTPPSCSRESPARRRTAPPRRRRMRTRREPSTANARGSQCLGCGARRKSRRRGMTQTPPIDPTFPPRFKVEGVIIWVTGLEF